MNLRSLSFTRFLARGGKGAQLKSNKNKNMKYRKYLKSSLWSDKKKEISKFERGRECWICGEAGVETHHLNYARVSHEKIEDLVFLCRKHHQKIHDLVHREKISIHKATYRVKKEWTRENGHRWGARDTAEYFRQAGIVERNIGFK